MTETYKESAFVTTKERNEAIQSENEAFKLISIIQGKRNK